MYRPDHNRIGQALVLLPVDVEVVPDRNIDQDDVEEEGFTKRLRYLDTIYQSVQHGRFDEFITAS
jgi:hypothetical protein